MANAVETPSQNNLMTEGSIVKSLLLFALPLIFGNLLQQLYNTADSIIVGNFVGANALAAVGSSGSPIYLLIGFSQGLAVGAGVVVSQFLGAKDHREAQEAVHTSLAIAVIMGLLLTVGGIACGRALLVAMNTPAEVLGDAVTYIRIYFGGVLFSVVYNMTAGILNAAGNSRRSLIYLAWASVTNIVLDLVFIVIFRMGVAGAAIATDISQLVSCVLSLRFLIKSTDDCRVIPREIRLHKKMAARIIRVGLPTGIQNMVISFSNVLVQASVNSYGAAAMAGFAAYMKIDGFNILPVSSISMAATTFVGQNYGAGRLDRVKKGTWVTLAVGVVYTLITGTLLLLGQNAILHLFTQDEAVVTFGAAAMRWFCPFYFLLSILHGLAGAVRGTGASVPPMVVLLVSLCLFRIVWIQWVLPLFSGIEGVFILYPVSWALGAGLMILYVQVAVCVAVFVEIVFEVVVDGFDGLGGAEQRLRVPAVRFHGFYDLLPDEVFKGFLAAPVSGLLGERLPDEKRLFALHDLNKPLAGRQLHGRFCADRLCHASLSPFTTVLNGLPVNARGTNPYRFTQSVFTIWTQRE